MTARPDLLSRWWAMARVGLAMIFHNKLKSLGTLLGVVFAVILSNQQAGTLLGLVYKNVMFVKNADADLWIAPASTEAFQAGKPLALSALFEARSTPGVASAEPLLFGATAISLPGGGSEAVQIVGTRAPAFKGGPWNLVVGSTDVLLRPDTMIFEDAEREKLGALNVGSVRELGGHRVQVGGFTWGLLPFGPGYAFAEYDHARLLLRRPADQADFILVSAAPGSRHEDVRDALQRALPATKVFTRQEFVRSSVVYLFTRTPIGVTFGTSALFGLIVGFVIVSLTIFSSVVDNLREFGTLKAIGATNGDLTILLLVQAIFYGLAGSLLGLTLVTRIAYLIRSPKLAINLPPEMLAGTTVLMVLLCIVASSIALFRLRKLEPAMVFR